MARRITTITERLVLKRQLQQREWLTSNGAGFREGGSRG
jgi:hypothetical protein